MDLNRDIAQGRDIISIAIQSNRPKRNEQIIRRETLIVSEMLCHWDQAANGTSDRSTKLVERIHLIVLINREPSPEASNQTRSTGSNGTKEVDQVGGSKSDTKAAETITTSAQSKRAVGVLISVGHGEFRAPSNPTATYSRSDSFLSPTARVPTTLRDPILKNEPETRSDSNSPRLFKESISFPNELDSVRLRLRSNSLLMLTVSASFVILTYTLCLLIYLKSRQKFRSKGSKVEVRPVRSDIVASNTFSSSQKQRSLNISQPFNLQMPPATRARLDVMLAHNCRTKRLSCRQREIARPGKSEAERRSRARRPVASSRRETRQTARRLVNRNPKIEPRDSDTAQHRHILYPVTSSHKVVHTDGTLSVVRAIRYAATLARSRLQVARYRPNLNVIVESDLEHLQTSMKSFEMLPDASNQNKPPLRKNSITDDHYESLVKDALSRKCSHVARRMHDAQTETLFSRPTDTPNSSSSQISRSRILRQL